ncbi:hypothetical protein BMS3Abin17_00233 [archaeon BMS3Abin17]|nr:hypothetical protein BMS3Abin17_00233 [archaeon BMS3Abin17]HDZ60801.1 hypothetical protein [Candidatus Pacearchaeota archaeon]
MAKESNINILKKEYKKIQKKHGLPDFERLNEDFQIEKISESETEILIREVRKFMSEKFSNYFRFVEVILHPVNAPMFIFSIVKLITPEEKNKLTVIYKRLAEAEISLIELDTHFVEKKEADFIKHYYNLWQDVKKDMLEVIDAIKKNWDNKLEGNSRNYFG